MKLTKYFYISEMCKKDGYKELMPIAYTKENEEAEYKREKMACYHERDGECEFRKTCEIWRVAPDIIEKEKEWQLYEKPLGR